MAIYTLLFAGVVEAQVSHADYDPVDEGGDGNEILKPGEDCGCRVGEGHVAETHEDGVDADCDPWTVQVVCQYSVTFFYLID